MGVDFGVRDATIAAAKSAYLATAIKHGHKKSFSELRYEKSKETSIKGEKLKKFPELNKIAQASPEAFYYWHLADKILQ